MMSTITSGYLGIFVIFALRKFRIVSGENRQYICSVLDTRNTRNFHDKKIIIFEIIRSESSVVLCY